MVKRAKVTTDTYDKKPSALDRLVGNVTPPPVESEQPEEAPSMHEPHPGGRTYKPTSIYLDDEQLDKLDDLAHDFKKRTRKRINRNDIVRALVDMADLDTILKIIRLD